MAIDSFAAKTIATIILSMLCQLKRCLDYSENKLKLVCMRNPASPAEN